MADSVTSHEAWGLGVYSVFTNPNIWLDRAVETPVNGNVRFHSIISVCLGANGGIVKPINATGDQTGCNASYTPTVTNYPTTLRRSAPGVTPAHAGRSPRR